MDPGPGFLGELGFHYNDVEYLSRLKELHLLPLEYKFRLTDLMLFHDIVYNTSSIHLPVQYSRGESPRLYCTS